MIKAIEVVQEGHFTAGTLDHHQGVTMIILVTKVVLLEGVVPVVEVEEEEAVAVTAEAEFKIKKMELPRVMLAMIP